MSRSSAWIRGMPYVPRLREWMPRIVSVSSASEQARAEGGRFDQAQKPLVETSSTRHIVATG